MAFDSPSAGFARGFRSGFGTVGSLMLQKKALGQAKESEQAARTENRVKQSMEQTQDAIKQLMDMAGKVRDQGGNPEPLLSSAEKLAESQGAFFASLHLSGRAQGIDVSGLPDPSQVVEQFSGPIQAFREVQESFGPRARGEAAAAETIAQTKAERAAGVADEPQQVFQAFDASGQALGTALFNPRTGDFTTTQGQAFPADARFVKGEIQATGAEGLGLEPSKKAEGLIDETLINLDSQITRLEDTVKTFDPEFLTFAGRLKGGALALGEKLGRNLSEDEKQFVETFSVFKQDAIENVNRTIKEMTGAQMSELEANRLRKQTPDPEKDSATEFLSKLKNSLNKAKITRARFLWMKRNNIIHDFSSDKEPPLSIDSMETIIEKRGESIAAEVKATNPGISNQEIARRVGERLRREFNL